MLKVMTFNIRGANFPDGVNIWENRAPLVRELLERYQPDLIGFQEFQEENARWLQPSLAEYAVELGWQSARESEFGFVFNAIYWRTARFEKVDGGGFYLSETPDVYSGDWGIIHNRVANWVRLRDKQTDETLVHLNTHYSHVSEEARIRSTELIINRLGSICVNREPAIITGDFNSRSTVFSETWRDSLTDTQKRQLEKSRHWIKHRNHVHELFRMHGFVDTFIEAGNLEEPKMMTGHSYLSEFELPPVNYRIDWILVWENGRSTLTSGCQIIRDAQYPIFPSDHYPVLAKISL